MDKSKILINKIIVHILDTNLEMPVLSQNEHPIDEEINEFIENHISKALENENLKEAKFFENENYVLNLCKEILENNSTFGVVTSKIATQLFEIMKKHVDISPSDLVFCLFTLNNTEFLGILKLNYKHSYIHYVNAYEEGNINSIIKQKTALPIENQKVDECAFINLKDFSIELIEKKCEIDGEKKFYFSENFLECGTKANITDKVKIFNKTSDKFNKKYFEGEFEKTLELRKATSESIEEQNAINIEAVADKVFKGNVELKTEYIQEIRKSGIEDDCIEVTPKITEKKFTRQKIKTDLGIEINIPVQYYNNKDRLEFINNPDGTISIIIKNIGKVIS